jgi:hypothetical protein
MLQNKISSVKVRKATGSSSSISFPLPLDCHDVATLFTLFPSPPYPYLFTRMVITTWRYKTHIIFVALILNIKMSLFILRLSIRVYQPPSNLILVRRTNGIFGYEIFTAFIRSSWTSNASLLCRIAADNPISAYGSECWRCSCFMFQWNCSLCEISTIILCMVHLIFQKSRRHLEILGPIRVTWNKFHTQDPKILGACLQNLFALVTFAWNFCTPAFMFCLFGVCWIQPWMTQTIQRWMIWLLLNDKLKWMWKEVVLLWLQTSSC